MIARTLRWLFPLRSPTVTCSFCGKKQNQVRKLIASRGVHICDECVELCNDIIATEIAAEEASLAGCCHLCHAAGAGELLSLPVGTVVCAACGEAMRAVEKAKAEGAERATATPDASAPIACTFCTKSQDEVRKLIAGPTVCICDECIDLSNDIIAEASVTADPAKEVPPQPCALCGTSVDGGEMNPLPSGWVLCQASIEAIRVERDSRAARPDRERPP